MKALWLHQPVAKKRSHSVRLFMHTTELYEDLAEDDFRSQLIPRNALWDDGVP
jgi:hypothetical protein